MRFAFIITFFVLTAFSNRSNAQLNVYPNGNANQLINTIVGNNITVSNAQLNCGAGGSATFTAVSTNLNITSGILLTTGLASVAIGPNDQTGDGDCHQTGPNFEDPDLNLIEEDANYDGCVLQFDIVPICNTLNINYVFASEEYPEYVNASFNDAFGFFITGPNPSGGNYNGFNIAKLPNGTPVSIDNVNSLSNSSYYVNNNGGSSIQYDGFTVPLVAEANVIPCQTYHLKLVIADAGDCIYDSGVFLAYKGLTCPSTQIPNIATTSSPVQCGNDGSATVTVTNYTGTPTYTWTPTGGNAATATGLGPGTYTVTVGFANPCPYTQTVTAVVTGTNVVNSTMSSTPSTCNAPNGTATASVSGGTGPYSYSWSTNPAQTTATASGLVPGTYTVTITDNSGCVVTRTVSVSNTQPALSVVDSVLNTTCGQSNGAIFVNSVSGGSSPYFYSWSGGQTTDDITNITADSYTLVITDALNCSWEYTFDVPNVVELPVDSSWENERCEQGNGSATLNVLNGVAPFTYTWNTVPVQTTATASGLSAGVYSVTVTDAAGCFANATFTITNVDDVFTGSVLVTPPEPKVGEVFNVSLNSPVNWNLIFSSWPDGTSSTTSSSSFNMSEYGNYNGYFTVGSENGCYDSIPYTIFVKDFMTLYVPNAFTPNGDFDNDIFRAYGTLVKTFHMLIYDRWGNLIYEGETLERGWDGTFKGELVMRDVYVWKIYAVDFFNVEHSFIGHVTVVR